MIGISKFEPPLVTDGLDIQDFSFVSGSGVLLCPYVNHGWNCDGHQDQGGNDRPCDLKFVIAVGLVR